MSVLVVDSASLKGRKWTTCRSEG